jgi:hypothetical protein
MARINLIIKYQGKDSTGTGTALYRSTCNCVLRVAKFLKIDGKAYTPTPGADMADRASYARDYYDATGTKQSVTVAAGKFVYAPDDKARGKAVELTTGLKTTGKNNSKLTITFPSFLTVADIGDCLGEIIPPGSIQRTAGTAPGATEIYPFFKIKGGRTYPIPLAATVTGTTTPDVGMTEAEQAEIATTTKSKTKKKK